MLNTLLYMCVYTNFWQLTRDTDWLPMFCSRPGELSTDSVSAVDRVTEQSLVVQSNWKERLRAHQASSNT